jgi:UTP-glucose-1-phosphate uridylyltransferase
MERLIGGLPFDALIHSGTRFDCGSKVGLLEANVALALERDDLEGVEAAVRRALGD